MCLIAVAWKTRPDLPLALIANRDEWHARPTAPAGVDPGAPDVRGGRDLEQGGSWLQASSRRRLAAVTNVRTGGVPGRAARSRGWLVREFVRGALPAPAFARALQPLAGDYGPFNLLLWDGDALWHASNSPGFVAHPVMPGLHAMSNGAFDAPWPKSAAATGILDRWLQAQPSRDDAAGTPLAPSGFAPLFEGLRDTRPAPAASLPDTGIGPALERRLSPVFIEDADYGTRCSTVVMAGHAELVLVERRFAASGRPDGESILQLGMH
ncbi:NRDE family protein [Luteimonas deserti]|uniref:NRDE family protein n=1 Tax=Luteimonas deserti TaxID=2752306 RepID=A0A7Z0TUK7_9GAMM|nr:NRDE family protein [Luteimonas deserti]NYZ61264.1 NRDE family protein [Luteimonas deserti]